MKKLLLVFIVVIISSSLYSQKDTLGVRNYFGVNISPVIGKLLGKDAPKPNRIGIVYRRCIGLYNLKIAFVGMNDIYPNFVGGNYSYAFNDTTYSKVRTTPSNQSRDIRLGLERKWGSKNAKVFLGAGVSMGTFKIEERYLQYYYKVTSDSLGVYQENHYYDSDRGEDKSRYIKIGFDFWGGIAWDIGKHFNFMVQINPDLSNFSLIKNERIDPTNRFPLPNTNFTFGALGSIDLMLGVRF